MENVEQFNQNFNTNKPKKKGLIIGVILVVLAVALVYFLVLTNPKFIFSKTIDKLLTFDAQSYDTIKMNTEIKASVDLEDTMYQTELSEVDNFTLKAGTQMDAEKKKQIVELGLEYDDEEVVDAQLYYNDGDMYAYLEGLFDKYIQIDMDAETKDVLDEVFETATSKEDLKNTKKALEIVRDEFKSQVKENGKFEKEKDKIEVGEDEVKVNKVTLTLTEKQLWKVAVNMLSNLADNKKFLDCFEDDTIGDDLKELAELMEENKTDGKSDVKISLYTKGLLNKLVAVDVQVYVPDEATVTMSVVKEDKGVYSYNVSGKSGGINVDVVKGKVEIEKDKDSKKEQSGKVTLTADVIELGSAKLEVNYSAKYNQGIDKIDTSNSVNMNDLTETDLESIGTKLMDRPLIGEVLEEYMYGGIYDAAQDAVNETEDMMEQEMQNNTLTTSQNEVTHYSYGYSVKYSLPSNFKYDAAYSFDYIKNYTLEDSNDSYIDAEVYLEWSTESEYVEDEIKWDYDYYTENSDYYKNINLSEAKTLVVGNKSFKYVVLSYETNYGSKSQDVYVWHSLDDEHMFIIKLESENKEVTEDIIKGFLNINVTKLYS